MKRAISVALLVIMVLPPTARAGQLAARGPAAVGDAVVERLDLTVGRSAIIRMTRPIVRVSLSTPEIADAMVTSPYELLVHGKMPGTISLLVWGDNGRITTYDVAVRRDLTALEAQIKSLFPGEAITVAGNGRDVVLSGVVSSKYIVDRASSLAVGYVDKPENVVNLIHQQEGLATNQILLRVRFAEVSRTAMQELGAGFFTGAAGKGDWLARGTTQQYPAPDFDQDKGLVFSDFLNLFAFNTEEQIGAVIKALKGKGLFQSLAEPNLITQDGKEASFLAGGEYPYPVMQGSGNNSTVTIVFKEYGVRLKFTPTVTGDDMIHLKVAPEVSSLDFGNAVVLEGFRIPALSTRRTETQVELRDGQTFAIAGLLDQKVSETLRRVPGIGDIPILGYLFRSQAYTKNATELVVMITPHIVRRDSSGVTPNLPGHVVPYLEEPSRRLPAPPPAFLGTPRSEQTPAQKPGTAAAMVTPAPTVSRPAATPALTAAPAAAVVPAPMATSTSKPTPTIVQTPAAMPVPAAAPAPVPVAPRVSDGSRQTTAKAMQEQQKSAKAEAARLEKEQVKQREELARQEKIDQKRREIEQKAAEKRAAEQAVLDRKRWLQQQEQAAEAKVVADKVAKEQARRDAEQQRIDAARQEEERQLAEKHRRAQEKLAKEQAGRDGELERLVTQYQKLTEGQAATQKR